MKVFAISKDGRFFKMGDTQESSEWYGVADNVKAYIKDVKRGDEVNIKSEKNNDGKLTITYLQKTASGPASSSSAQPAKTYGKSPEEQESIKRQAIGHMTSRTLIALQGKVDESNVEALIDKIYDKYVAKVG